ncbi:MAG: hypothetical protein R2751_13600 [Bacteroidales bacterium]
MPLVSNWAKLNGAEEEVSGADYPGIRLLTVQRATSFLPLDTMTTDGWTVCSPESVKGFSATAYFFGRTIWNELQVPVGLIHSSWGGTVAEAWTSASTLMDDPDFREQTARIASQAGSRDSVLARYERDLKLQALEKAEKDPGIRGQDTLWARGDIQGVSYVSTDVPGAWEDSEFGVFDGSGWYVKNVNLSPTLASEELTLCIGPPDDWDEAWVNGVKVGESKEWGTPGNTPFPRGLPFPVRTPSWSGSWTTRATGVSWEMPMILSSGRLPGSRFPWTRNGDFTRASTTWIWKSNPCLPWSQTNPRCCTTP